MSAHPGAGASARRPLCLAASLVAVVTGVLALVAAAPAVAGGEGRFRMGVMDSSFAPVSDFRAMRRMHVRSARLSFLWYRIETRRGEGPGCESSIYDWSYYDQVVAEASRRGVHLSPVLIGSPEYAAPRHSNAPPTNSDAIGDWKCFVSAVVGRYGRGGTYPSRINPAATPVTEWQVWNEPSVRAYAAWRKPNPREYARFLKLTRPQIRRQDPAATIVLAGVPEFLDKGMDARPFLKRFYRVKRIERAFDVVSLHPYARNHRGVRGALIRMRRLLRNVGDGRRWLWIREVGWATDGPKGHFLVKDERGQARQLRKTFRMVKRNRKRYRIGTVNWFRWRDRAEPLGQAFDHAGLFRTDGTPKRACHGFVRFTGGTCRTLPGTSAVARSLSYSTEGRDELPPARLVPSPPE